MRAGQQQIFILTSMTKRKDRTYTSIENLFQFFLVSLMFWFQCFLSRTILCGDHLQPLINYFLQLPLLCLPRGCSGEVDTTPQGFGSASGIIYHIHALYPSPNLLPFYASIGPVATPWSSLLQCRRLFIHQNYLHRLLFTSTTLA